MSRLGALFGLTPSAVRVDGARVHLRQPERADWPEWAELRGESRAFLKPWEPSWAHDALTRAAFRRRLARYAADWRDGEAYNFFVCRNEDGKLAGGIGLSQVRRGVAETGSVGYWIGERYARRGYMTEAVALLTGFAFGELGLRRLEAACLPTNIPSRKLLEHVGFRQEGYAREYLCIDGAWQDHLLFGLLSDRR
ncbi:MAG TPA: GNAT family protein [Stellaceae bacterium]|nr:GNAT family protein [Stellaceae bacterium]